MSTAQRAQAAAPSPEAQRTEPASDYESIRAIVAAWPPALRATLMHDLINTLVKETDEPRPRKKTLHEALGLANNGEPAPSDEEVQRWLDERREAKYG